MPKIRTRAAVKTTASAKKPKKAAKKTTSHGGARKGAGRKPSPEGPMDSGLFVRCTSEQKAAILAFVEAKGTGISTWIRELALRSSGNRALIRRRGGKK